MAGGQHHLHPHGRLFGQRQLYLHRHQCDRHFGCGDGDPAQVLPPLPELPTFEVTADAGAAVGRFVINTTIGIVGVLDTASAMGIQRKRSGHAATERLVQHKVKRMQVR